MVKGYVYFMLLLLLLSTPLWLSFVLFVLRRVGYDPIPTKITQHTMILYQVISTPSSLICLHLSTAFIYANQTTYCSVNRASKNATTTRNTSITSLSTHTRTSHKQTIQANSYKHEHKHTHNQHSHSLNIDYKTR